MTMDSEWMRERLESFKILCERYQDERSRTTDYPSTMQAISDQMTFQMPTIRQILKRLDPVLAQQVTAPDHLDGISGSLRAVQEGLGILRDQDEWAVKLAPNAPSLIADQFHSRIWVSASALWDTGQYRVAVAQAAVSLSAHIAKKAGSHLTERELVSQVFSPTEPNSNQTRLHLPGEKSSKTWKSRQEGLHLIAQSVFAGIRNIAAHTDDEWSEQVALEHLAVLSVVARWTDETEVVTVPEVQKRCKP